MFSCNKKLCEPTPIIATRCIDSSILSGSVSCFETFDLMCGCDGITCGNSCYANFSVGVTSYIAGECPDYFFLYDLRAKEKNIRN